MGYRLEISEIQYKASGGKLFGYVDKEKLLSHKWLLDKGFIDGDEYWNYGCNPQIVLTAEEFREFFKLYGEDLKNFYKYDINEIIDKDLEDLLKSKNDKLLEWW
jgi:hypothetical protein